MTKINQNNNHNRLLFESIVVPEVISALTDWTNINASGTLIGGLALSFYIKPRHTQDVDLLYLSEDEIPLNVVGFKKTRDNCFQHNKTHVEIEVLTPAFIDTSEELIERVIKTSITSSGMKIASANGLVALKLGRGNLQDQADIEQLYIHAEANITEFNKLLNSKEKRLFNRITQYNEIQRNN